MGVGEGVPGLKPEWENWCGGVEAAAAERGDGAIMGRTCRGSARCAPTGTVDKRSNALACMGDACVAHAHRQPGRSCPAKLPEGSGGEQGGLVH